MPDKTVLTLSQKQDLMRQTVAMPEARDWHLIEEDAEIARHLVETLNSILLSALMKAKARGTMTFGEIAHLVYPPMFQMGRRSPGAGVTDSEAFQTVALFFSVNYDPSMYHFFRYEAPSEFMEQKQARRRA